MEKTIRKIQKKVARLKAQYDGCRGGGMAGSDFERMRELRFEMKGIKYALRLLRS